MIRFAAPIGAYRGIIPNPTPTSPDLILWNSGDAVSAVVVKFGADAGKIRLQNTTSGPSAGDFFTPYAYPLPWTEGTLYVRVIRGATTGAVNVQAEVTTWTLTPLNMLVAKVSSSDDAPITYKATLQLSRDASTVISTIPLSFAIHH